MKRNDLPEFSPLAIVGMACVFPEAENLDAYWHNLKSGRDAIREIPPTHWNPADYFDADPKTPDHTYAKRGGFIPAIDFHPLEFGLPPSTLEATDTSQILGLVAAQRALIDAGYAPTGGGAGRVLDRSRVSVILGVTGTLELVVPLGARLGHPHWRKALRDAGVDAETAERVVEGISSSYVEWQENSFPGLLGNVVAGRIANRLDLGGTNCVVDAACASSLSAMHLAALELASGRSDLALTGGIDTFNDIFMYMCFSKTPALSPTGNARPFDSSGDGTILGEGLGVVALRRLEDAKRDGNKIYAILRGLGSSSDGRGNAIYAPSSAGQAVALRRTYEMAGITAGSIDLVEAHGTGTVAGDAAEVRALTEVYRKSSAGAQWCALGSVKSQIGHTKAAAGVAGLIKAVLALHHKILPPTIKVTAPLPDLAAADSPFYLLKEKRPWFAREEHPRRAAVSSFGFGGSNYHCVLEEADLIRSHVDWDADVLLFAYSAGSAGELQNKLASLADAVDARELRSRAVESRNTFDASLARRLAFVVEPKGRPLAEVMREIIREARGAAAEDAPHGRAKSDGIFAGAGEIPGKLALLFPGQGSQYVGMLRDLACDFPEMEESLEAANKSYWSGSEERARGARLTDHIYPPSAFNAETEERNELALRDTSVAQPAIGAVSLGAYKVLRRFGVEPQGVAGHSFGELTALCASRRIGENSFHTLSNFRGRLMGERRGDRGSMLAVQAPLEAVEQVLRAERLELVIANRNAPAQVVLSGASAEIERAERVLRERKIPGQRLPVSAAFHSALVADARKPFLEALGKVRFDEEQIPVYANSTAARYPAGAKGARDLLAGQLARPVEFMAEINAMYEAGMRVFVEVGPSNKLSGLVRAILAGRPHRALALDQSRGRGNAGADLARLLAELAALGYPIQLAAWDPDGGGAWQRVRETPAGGVKICGANYRAPRHDTKDKQSEKKAKQSETKEKRSEMKEETTRPISNTPVLSPSAGAPISGPASSTITRTTARLPVATPTGVARPNGGPLPSYQENLSALARLQAETARLHGQFLESQIRAQEMMAKLLDAQLGIASPERLPEHLSSAYSPAEPLAPAQVRAPGPLPQPQSQPQPRHAAAELPNPSPKPPVSAAPPVPPPQENQVSVAQILAEVVAEKTGYPAEMLEMTMELDADLGIDSIKRVEILSALQEKLPHLRAVRPDELGRIRTLADIAAALGEEEGNKMRGLQTRAPDNLRGLQARAPENSRGLETRAAEITTLLLRTVAEKTGYPQEMLALTMELDADLGIDSIKRVEILSALEAVLPGIERVKPDELGRIRTLGDIVTRLCQSANASTGANSSAGATATSATASAPRSAESAPASAAAARPPLELFAVEPVELAPAAERDSIRIGAGSLFWITLDGGGLAEEIAERLRLRGHEVRIVTPKSARRMKTPAALGGLILLTPAEGTTDAFLRDVLRLVQIAAPSLREEGKRHGALLATVSRLDGKFGFAGKALEDPLSGALAGLPKCAALEWEQVSCRALDLAPDGSDPALAASLIVDELFAATPREAGIAGGTRWRLALARAAPPGMQCDSAHCDSVPPLAHGDVVVISGGARGVTAEVAKAIARDSKPILAILGRSDFGASGFQAEEPAWLHGLADPALIKRAILEHAETRMNPREVQEAFQKLMAEREARANLRELQALAGQAHYYPVDLRDAEAVARCMKQIRAAHGAVRALVHGAGVLADQLIADKDEESFRAVFDTKVAGLRHLLAHVDPAELRALVLFSSSTARFGRKGQVDYGMANEALNKLAQDFAARHAHVRVLSPNWGPWEGGMVTPELRKLFEREGIALIPLADGAELLSRALADRAAPVEMVVLGAGSKISEIEAEPAAAAAPTRAGTTRPPGSAARPAREFYPLAFSRSIDLESCPFLRSHVLDGRAVLPAAMMLEWLAHTAMQRSPGLQFAGADRLRILKGVVLPAAAREELQFRAGNPQRRDDLYAVPVQLSGITADGREYLHAEAEILLTAKLTREKPRLNLMVRDPYPIDLDEAYESVLFHGDDLRGITAMEGISARAIIAQSRAAPPPRQWIREPLRAQWLLDPLALDVAFQLIILWSHAQRGHASLPCAIGRYRQFTRAFPAAGTRILAEITEASESTAKATIEFLDSAGELVARIEEYECVIDPSLKQAFRNNRLPESIRP